MDLSLWVVFALTYWGIMFSPGPNVMLLLTHAARYGYRHIFVAMAGNLTYQLIVVAALGLGVGTLLKTGSPAYLWLKYLGAAYLVYLGLRIVFEVFVRGRLRRLDAPVVGEARAVPPALQRYIEAFTVSAGNPNMVMFLSAFLPQFVVADRPVLPQFAIMYATIVIIVCGTHSLFALLIVSMRARLTSPRASRTLSGISAAIYLFLGVSMVLSN